MRVICTGKLGRHLPRWVLELGGFGREETDYGLEIGKTYTVYAMSQLAGSLIEFFVNPEKGYSDPSYFFDVSDRRLSKFWVFGQEQLERFGNREDALLSVCGYPEYVNSNAHRTGLLEGSQEAFVLFNKYKTIMELEYGHAEITTHAEIIEAEWLQCPNCADAWQSKSILELVRCPSCLQISWNPKRLTSDAFLIQ